MDIILCCKCCSKEFSVKYKRRHTAKYCSIACRVKSVKNKPMYWLGKKMTQEVREKMRVSHLGEKNHLWKGEDASYSAKHLWIKRQLGRANKCLSDKCNGISKNYDWANISGLYLRQHSDWTMLCKSCHKKYDSRLVCKNGHKRTDENTRIKKNGTRSCLICRKNERVIK